MASGYVYILINQSMPGLIKVGCTSRDTRARARELFTTGIPTPFQVAFEIFSDSHEKLEADLQAELHDFRVAGNREFFRYPLSRAITLLQQLNAPPVSPDSVYLAEDILTRLNAKYPAYLRPEIVAVRIVQSKERVWLEITEEKEIAGYLKDQIIRRSDLAFIIFNRDVPYFLPTDDISETARKFVEEYDPYSIIMTTNLFHVDACCEVDKLHNPNRDRLRHQDPSQSS